jgi:hypothetical protein
VCVWMMGLMAAQLVELATWYSCTVGFYVEAEMHHHFVVCVALCLQSGCGNLWRPSFLRYKYSWGGHTNVSLGIDTFTHTQPEEGSWSRPEEKTRVVKRSKSSVLDC